VSAPDEHVKWDREIVPRRGLFAVPWRELLGYRDLILLLARRDLSAQFKQTVLGPLWFVLQPLMTTIVFSLIFGQLLGSADQKNTAQTPHFIFYMSALTIWGFFTECVTKTAHTFTRNAQLFGKVYFPRLAVPISQVLTALASFTIQFGVLLAGLAFYLAKHLWFPDPAHPIHLDPNWRAFLLPLFLLQTAMLGLGIGLIVSSLSTRYRDLAMATGFGLQLLMYGSSVAFPVGRLENAVVAKILMFNPMVPIVESMRFAFTGRGTVTKEYLAISFAVSVIVLLIGVMSFNRTEQNVMDTV
jgi:lipopolysaccharide transport system permease protein